MAHEHDRSGRRRLELHTRYDGVHQHRASSHKHDAARATYQVGGESTEQAFDAFFGHNRAETVAHAFVQNRSAANALHLQAASHELERVCDGHAHGARHRTEQRTQRRTDLRRFAVFARRRCEGGVVR